MTENNEFDPIGGDGVPASPDAVPQETSPRLEAERAEFCEWIATAAPFDANVGMVEHAMKTSAAWEGWMARAAAQDFREVLPASMASPGGRHPALPLLPPQHDGYIADLSKFAAFDGDGLLEPKRPYSWETLARVAIDLANARLCAAPQKGDAA